MTVYSSENTKVLILQKIYILKFVKGFCTWRNFCHFIGGVWRSNNYSSVKERRFWGVGLKQHFFPIDLFFIYWKKKHKSAHEKEKTYRWRKKKFTSKLKNPKKCLLRSQDMSIKTKKWSEQSERVCVKTNFPFVKVKDKVKKWLSLVTLMFNLENNSGLMYMNVDCLRGFSYYREIHTKHPPPLALSDPS